METYENSPYPQQRRRGFKILPLMLFGLFFIYYYYSNQEVVPITGRKQLVDMNREQEMALGFSSYQQILQQEQIIESGPEVDTIREIGKRIAAVTEDPGFDWEYNLIQSDQVNAFCLPGGKVAVYTGILPVAENTDGLAVIMGHEIAHAIARHGAERMAHQKLAQFGQLALGMSMSEMDDGQKRAVMGAFGLGAQFGVLLPFSRSHESEADYMGLMYVARACFNPEEAPKLWERMAAAQKSQKPAEFMSTHPSDETRIENFKKWMPEALAEREKYCSPAQGSK
ncbi:M48 family metallopeptidase [bacterium]|nr:M48 family metallopeptidase [bacterium]